MRPEYYSEQTFDASLRLRRVPIYIHGWLYLTDAGIGFRIKPDSPFPNIGPFGIRTVGEMVQRARVQLHVFVCVAFIMPIFFMLILGPVGLVLGIANDLCAFVYFRINWIPVFEKLEQLDSSVFPYSEIHYLEPEKQGIALSKNFPFPSYQLWFRLPNYDAVTKALAYRKVYPTEK